MENIIFDIINKIITNFDFSYMFAVNVLAYIFIKLHDEFNGNYKVKTLYKRLWLVLAILLMGVVYTYEDDYSVSKLINSAVLAPVFYSWIIKPILKKIGANYKETDDYLGID